MVVISKLRIDGFSTYASSTALASKGREADAVLNVATAAATSTQRLLLGKTQLSEEEVTRTRRIASVRIHVERAINRIKTYRILKHAVAIKSRKHINAIVFVCAGLCNLKGPLIKKNE